MEEVEESDGEVCPGGGQGQVVALSCWEGVSHVTSGGRECQAGGKAGAKAPRWGWVGMLEGKRQGWGARGWGSGHEGGVGGKQGITWDRGGDSKLFHTLVFPTRLLAPWRAKRR